MGATPINTIGFDRNEVIEQGGRLAFVTAPAYGPGSVTAAPDSVKLTQGKDDFTLENAHLKATVTRGGAITSLVHKATGRQSLAGPANVFEMYVDTPTNWDAWDVEPQHLETRTQCPPAHSAAVKTNDRLRAELAFEQQCGTGSQIRYVVRLDAASRRVEIDCQVDWNESHKMLKVAVPVNARAMNATYEMQFHPVERPTHFNTSYDLARFEVPLHKWMDLSEYGFGVALLSESKYGASTFGQTMHLSLLRSPKAPDPIADMGTHRFSYAILPHADGWREAGVVAEGYRFNNPIRLITDAPTTNATTTNAAKTNAPTTDAAATGSASTGSAPRQRRLHRPSRPGRGDRPRTCDRGAGGVIRFERHAESGARHH